MYVCVEEKYGDELYGLEKAELIKDKDMSEELSCMPSWFGVKCGTCNLIMYKVVGTEKGARMLMEMFSMGPVVPESEVKTKEMYVHIIPDKKRDQIKSDSTLERMKQALRKLINKIL